MIMRTQLTLVCILLLAATAVAADRVVVVPLGGSVTTTHYYTLPGVVFNGDYSAGHNESGTISVHAGKRFFAPVILPEQATVTEFVVWAKNGSTSVADNAYLMRYDRNGASPTAIATANIPENTGFGDFQLFTAPTISPDVIDNVNYAYAAVLYSGDGALEVSAIRITYTSY